MEAHQGRGFLAAVEAHVVAAGAIGCQLARGDRAFEHHFAMAGHLQVQGFAAGQAHPFTGVDAGKQPFAELHRNWRGRGHHQQGMDPNRHGHLQGLAQGRGLAQVPGAAAHAQPMDRGRIDRLLLQPVHPHVGHARFRVLGNHQAQGDHGAGIPGPGAQQGQDVQVHVGPLEHLLLARGEQVQVRAGLEQVEQQAAKAARFLEALWGPRLLQEG